MAFMAFSVFTCDEIEWFSERVRERERKKGWWKIYGVCHKSERGEKNNFRTTRFNDVV